MVTARFLTGKFLAGSIANKNAILCAPRPPRVTGGRGDAATHDAAAARAFPVPGVDD